MVAFIDFSLFITDMSALRLLVLVVMVISWILGVKSVTQKGKIFDFVEDFFYKEVDVKEYKAESGNAKLDLDIIAKVLPDNYRELPQTDESWEVKQWALAIEVYLADRKEYSDDPAMVILSNLIDNKPNKYWHYKKVRKYSDKLIDPIIGCPTCMPSLHTMFVYTVVCWLKDWHWNPFVWGFVAISATFWTEFLWRRRNMDEKKFKKL